MRGESVKRIDREVRVRVNAIGGSTEEILRDLAPVSYTHLTLPTIYSV